MGDEPEPRPPEDGVRPEGSGESEGQPKPAKPRLFRPSPLPSSDAGGDRLRELEHRFKTLLSSGALFIASRRKASAIDRPDYDAAYDLIVISSNRSKTLFIISDILVLVSGVLIGYAASVYTGNDPSWRAGHIAVGSGLIMGVVGIVIKYFPGTR